MMTEDTTGTLDGETEDRAARTGAVWLGVLTLLALIPPVWYVWYHAVHQTGSWQANHVYRVDAARGAVVTLAVPAAGAAVGWLLARRRPWPPGERALTTAGGAFVASFLLSLGGFAWVFTHLRPYP